MTRLNRPAAGHGGGDCTTKNAQDDDVVNLYFSSGAYALSPHIQEWPNFVAAEKTGNEPPDDARRPSA